MSNATPTKSSHPSASSSITLNSPNVSPMNNRPSNQPSTIDREGPSNSTSPPANNSTVKHSRNGSLRRGGGFLLRSAISAIHTDRRGNGDTSSKGKQKVTPSKPIPRSHPVDSPELTRDSTSSELAERETPGADYMLEDSSTEANSSHGGWDSPPTRPQGTLSSVDASQIVNMALNLSEGRRRNFSNTQILPAQNGRSHRVVSASTPGLDYSLGSSVGGSLRRHLQDQRRISRSSPINNNRTSMQSPRSALSATVASLPRASMPDPDMHYNVSTGTLARVEKLRKYMELSAHHRDLLLFLPPLKSRPGTSREPHDNHRRPHSLGREYNPLQIIRNRKARARARLELNPGQEAWESLDDVSAWLTQVQHASSHKDYLLGDETWLPIFQARNSITRKGSSETSLSKGLLGGGRATRHRIDWYIAPTEMLADAYWLENNQHKGIIEDSQGHKVFPEVVSVQARPPRPSMDSQLSYQPSVQLSNGTDHSAESDFEKDFERRGRKLTKLQDPDASGRLKQVWKKARRRSRSTSSGLSVSDDDSGSRTRKPTKKNLIGYEGTQSTENHHSMLDVHRASLHAPSPSIISPGTPNKWGREAIIPQIVNPRPIDTHINDQITTPEQAWGPFDKSKDYTDDQALSHTESRKSIDESNPSSPVTFAYGNRENNHSSPLFMESPTKKSKRPLPFGRIDHALTSRYNEPIGSQESDVSLQRRSEEPLRLETSLEALGGDKDNLARASTHQDRNRLFRSNSYNDRRYSRDMKEPDSAVRRFFKGGKLGDLVRGERSKTSNVVRRKDGGSDNAEALAPRLIEDSDAEDTSGSSGLKDDKVLMRFKSRPSSQRQSLEEPRSPQQRLRSRLDRLDMPLFRPTTPRSSRPGTPEVESRPDRGFGFPITSAPSNTSILAKQNPSISFDEDKRRRLLPAFTSTRRLQSNKRLEVIKDISVTSSPAPQTDAVVPRPQNKRQWSISDKAASRSSLKPIHTPVTGAEIARIRALLLCTGIKAAELVRRANSSTSTPPPFLVTAAKAADTVIPTIPPIEAHGAATKLLLDSLNAQSITIHNSAAAFRTTAVADSRASVTDLRAKVSDSIERARLAGDDAVGHGALVTGQKTIEVQQVITALDKFRRRRGRRLRWMRRVAFGLLEWGVVFFMWGVWLVVLILRLFWNVLRALVKVARWAFWLN